MSCPLWRLLHSRAIVGMKIQYFPGVDIVHASLCPLRPIQLLKELELRAGIKGRKLGLCPEVTALEAPRSLCRLKAAESLLTFPSFFNSVLCLHLKFFLVRAGFSVEVTLSNKMLWRILQNKQRKTMALFGAGCLFPFSLLVFQRREGMT